MPSERYFELLSEVKAEVEWLNKTDIRSDNQHEVAEAVRTIRIITVRVVEMLEELSTHE